MNLKNNLQYSNKRSNLNKICLIAVLFLFFYNIPSHIIKIPFSSGKIIAIVSALYILVKALRISKQRLAIEKNYVRFLGAIVVSFGIVFFILKILYSTPDIYYLQVFFFYVFEYLFGAFFIVSYFKINSLQEFFESIIVIALMQALIMILCLFIPALKDFVMLVLSSDPGFSLFSGADGLKDGFRGLSLAADRTLGLSVFFSFSIMFLYCLLLLKKTKINNFYYILSFIIIFIGGVLAARTFFVGLFFGLMMLVVFFIKYKHHSKNLKRYFFVLLIVFFSIIFSIPAIIDSFFADSKQEIELGMKWAFEMFYNFFEKGTFSSASSDVLTEEHLDVIPNDFQTILIGDPNRSFVAPGFHYSSQFSDIGYVRMLMVYGIIGSLAVYFFWIYVLRLTAKLHATIPFIKYLLFFMGLTLFAANFKYDLFPGSAISLKLVVMLLVLGIVIKKNQEKLLKSNK